MAFSHPWIPEASKTCLAFRRIRADPFSHLRCGWGHVSEFGEQRHSGGGLVLQRIGNNFFVDKCCVRSTEECKRELQLHSLYVYKGINQLSLGHTHTRNNMQNTTPVIMPAILMSNSPLSEGSITRGYLKRANTTSSGRHSSPPGQNPEQPSRPSPACPR